MKILFKLALAALGFCSITAQATVYMVDNAEELVAAIIASNANGQADLIDMAPGLYLLEQQSESAGALGLPEVKGELHIRGNGSEIRRYADEDFEMLRVAASGRLHLDRVTLAEGSAGALTNHGTLILRHVRIVDHSTAQRGDAVISNFGDLQMNDVELGYNMVDAANSEATVLANHGTLTMVDSQFVDNRLSTRAPEAQIACALMNHGRAELRRVKVSGCQAEQTQLSSSPQTILNAESGSLMVELFSEEAAQVQFSGPRLAVAAH